MHCVTLAKQKDIKDEQALVETELLALLLLKYC